MFSVRNGFGCGPVLVSLGADIVVFTGGKTSVGPSARGREKAIQDLSRRELPTVDGEGRCLDVIGSEARKDLFELICGRRGMSDVDE